MVYVHYNLRLRTKKIEGSDGETINLDDINPSNEWVRNVNDDEDDSLHGDGLEHVKKMAEDMFDEEELESQDTPLSPSKPTRSRTYETRERTSRAEAAKERMKGKKRAHV